MRLDFLKKLVETPGISGNEKRISQVIQTEYGLYADEIIYDNLGSMYAVKRSQVSNPKRVIINAPMDEVGCIVCKLQENGLIRALFLGQVDSKAILGKKVYLTTRDDVTFSGVVLGLDQENNSLDKEQKVLLDFGFHSKEENREKGVHLGDMITFDSSYFVSENKEYVFATNLESRLSVLQTIDLLHNVKDMDLPFDLYIGCTVQEKVETRGIQTASNLVKADLAIMLQNQPSQDYQEGMKDDQGKLAEGLLINYYDASLLPNRLGMAIVKRLCQENNLSYQPYYSLKKSEGGWINKLRTGCPTISIGQAIRNHDSGIEVASVKDYQSLQKALVKTVEQFTDEQITEIKEENR